MKNSDVYTFSASCAIQTVSVLQCFASCPVCSVLRLVASHLSPHHPPPLNRAPKLVDDKCHSSQNGSCFLSSSPSSGAHVCCTLMGDGGGAIMEDDLKNMLWDSSHETTVTASSADDLSITCSAATDTPNADKAPGGRCLIRHLTKKLAVGATSDKRSKRTLQIGPPVESGWMPDLSKDEKGRDPPSFNFTKPFCTMGPSFSCVDSKKGIPVILPADLSSLEKVDLVCFRRSCWVLVLFRPYSAGGSSRG